MPPEFPETGYLITFIELVNIIGPSIQREDMPLRM